MKAILKRDFSPNSFWIYPIRKPDLSGVFFSVYSAGYEEIGKDYYLKRSEFYCSMITYISEGSGTLIYNGEHYDLPKGSLIMLNGMKEHILYPHSNGMTLYFFHIESSLLNSFTDYLLKKYNSPVIDLSSDESFHNEIDEIMLKLRKNPNSINDNSMTFYNLLLKIRNRVEVEDESSTLMMPDTVKNTLRYINEYYPTNITLDEISSTVGLSKFHLEKVFYKYTKMTVCKYLSTVRLKKAQELLLMSDDSIEEIALKVGLNDSQSIIRLFKKVHNETPFQYRQKRRIV